MSEDKIIKVWQFENAPSEYRELSPHGGDEDWLAFVPSTFPYGSWIPWLESGTPFGRCEVSEHEVEGGKVFIGAHA